MPYRHPRDPRRHSLARDVAYGLGWLSLGLGLVRLMAPRQTARAIGMQGSEDLLRAHGLREVVTGMGLLSARDPKPWMWARAAGDAMDIATLATGLGPGNPRRDRTAFAVGAAAGMAALDVACAEMLSAERTHPPLRLGRFRRSGFPAPAEEMRGAAGNFEVPADFRTPAALRPFPEGLAAAGVTNPDRPGTGGRAASQA